MGREDAFASGSQRRTEHPSEKPMEFMFGEPDRRPARVTACAGRTVAIRDAERDTSLHALIGVELDARVPMTRAQVRRDALRQLRIPEHLMLATKMKDATFLLSITDTRYGDTGTGTAIRRYGDFQKIRIRRYGKYIYF